MQAEYTQKIGGTADTHRQLFSETLVAEDIDLGSRVHTLGYKCAVGCLFAVDILFADTLRGTSLLRCATMLGFALMCSSEHACLSQLCVWALMGMVRKSDDIIPRHSTKPLHVV